MSESIRKSFQFILNKLGCGRGNKLNKSLRRDRLKKFDDSRSIQESESLSLCPSDCSSCEDAAKT